MDIKGRIIKFIAYKGIGQGKFEAACGLANGTVNNIKVTIGADKVQRIIGTYPEINLYWLITGDGEMLSEQETVETSSTTDRLLAIIESQQETIKNLSEIKKAVVLQEGNVRCADASGSGLEK